MMLASVTDRILSLDGWVALAIVFFIPALESSAFLGFIFPGEIAVLLGGVLASRGRAPLPAVIVAAVAGAIIGDSIGYAVGRRWGHQILRGAGRRIPILRHRIDEHLESATAYVNRRGAVAVFLGRFTAALRVMVPGLAGMSGMPYGAFALFNVLGGVLWGTAFVLLGYFAGSAWERAAGDASKIGLGLLLLVLAALVGGRLLRGLREGGEPLPERLAAVAPVAWVRGRMPRGSSWLARRVDTGSPRGFAWSVVVLAGAICGWVFVGLTQDVLAHEEAVLSDPEVMRFVVAHRAAWATAMMRSVTWLGSNAVLIPLVVAIGAWALLRKRSWRWVALLSVALLGANVWYGTAKSLVRRARPPVSLHLMHVSGFAFPSGHATSAIAVWGMLAFLLSRGTTSKQQAAIWAGAVVIVSAVATSRIYLGVHWWTDVVGGLALGGLWLCLLVLVATTHGVERAEGRQMDARSGSAGRGQEPRSQSPKAGPTLQSFVELERGIEPRTSSLPWRRSAD
jgi:membrane protein DedA with SNARE-associated domain/membrane-associated phospholipid phosphatase